MNEDIKHTLSVIPNEPGCYMFHDKKGTVIYVGKAKNLKRRVSSYFNKTHDHVKTRVLVKNIEKIKYVVVNNEEESFLLENSLIKELQPRYNVLLKDDKSYPYIVVKNEYFPRVFKTRKVVKDGSRYFGPYTSVHAVDTMVEMLRKVYKIRTCNLKLTPEDIAADKFHVCLQYHIKLCDAPCVGKILQEEYNKNIEEVIEILKGNISLIERKMSKRMHFLAEEMRYEEANQMKEKLELVSRFRERSQVVSSLNYNIDVFSYDEEGSAAFINYFHVVSGSITQAYTFEYVKRLDETPEELLAMGIVEMRQRFKSKSRETIVPFIPDIELESTTFTIPQRGDKKKLLDLSIKNVKQYKFDRLKRAEKLNPEQRTMRILSGVQKDLNLKELPFHIECFDNSNTQGTNPVSACVVFRKAKPSKKEYRHFNIKGVVGIDDYASMAEAIERRYTRSVNEGEKMPQLIVIDGGKGQLGVAVKTLQKIGVYEQTALIGIAERLEEIFIPGDPTPLYINKNSETLKLIQQVRNEAHRFGLSHHRRKRSKKQVASELDTIKGIGAVSKKKLLQRFKSIKRIKAASYEEIVETIGESRAKLIMDWIEGK